MSLRSLYENISEYSDFALIGRDFSAFGTDYSVLGFANSSDKTELVLLNFNCSKDDICCEDLTLRENVILEKKNNSDLSDDFSAIVIDGQRFDFDSVCGETLECCELTRSYIISEFMKLGWKSDRFLDAPLDSLFISFIELENKIDDLSLLDLTKNVEIIFASTINDDCNYIVDYNLDEAEKILVELIDERTRKHESAENINNTVHPGLGEDGKYHVKADAHPLPEGTCLTYALVGNQNCGKTTLFNQLTGSNQHVGNFPGVTVDRKDGPIKGYPNTMVTDLPGIYNAI